MECQCGYDVFIPKFCQECGRAIQSPIKHSTMKYRDEPEKYQYTIEATPKYLTCEEIAERFGVKVITVWQWIREKKLNAIRTGKYYRIRFEDVVEFEKARYTSS